MTFKTVAEVPAGMPEGDYFRLGDTTVEGLDPTAENFYQILPESCAVDAESAIVYVSEEASIAAVGDDSFAGWWDQLSMSIPMNDTLFPAGTAFIGSLGADHDVTLQSAGEAKQAKVNVNISGLLYPHMANPVPRDVKFKEIEVVGMDPTSENFYQVDQRSCAVDPDSAIVYVSEEASIAAVGDDSFAGWWDQLSMSIPLGEEYWHAGECYIGSMGGNDGVVVTFPSATNVVD